MTPQVKYKKLEDDYFNGPRPAPLLTVDPNPPHDPNHFSRFLRLENTGVQNPGSKPEQRRIGKLLRHFIDGHVMKSDVRAVLNKRIDERGFFDQGSA